MLLLQKELEELEKASDVAQEAEPLMGTAPSVSNVQDGTSYDAIVIDNSSWMMKAGFAGNNLSFCSLGS